MTNSLSLILGLSGAIFVIVGYVMLWLPPKEINHFYGYRTKRSMQTQERWDFAQRFSSIKMKTCGFVMLILAGLFLIFDIQFLSAGSQSILGVLILILCCVYLFYTTEKALREKFGKS